MPDGEAGGFAPDPDAELDLGLPPHGEGVLAMLGAKIREARTQADLTQEALSLLLPVSRAEVGHWETGNADPGVTGLLRIAEALGVPAASLLPATRKPEAQGSTQGRLARVEVKGFRDLGIVRVTESTLAGEPMLRAESTDGAVAEFPASSLHFITWLPEGAQVRTPEPAAIARDYHVDEPDDWNERNPF